MTTLMSLWFCHHHIIELVDTFQLPKELSSWRLPINESYRRTPSHIVGACGDNSKIFWWMKQFPSLWSHCCQTRKRGTTSDWFDGENTFNLIFWLRSKLYSSFIPHQLAMFCSVLRRFLSQLYLLLVIIYGMNVHAFSGRTLSTASSTMNRQMKTELMAWSLPNPSDFRSFPTMKSAWYDEYNPTARRTVYNE